MWQPEKNRRVNGGGKRIKKAVRAQVNPASSFMGEDEEEDGAEFAMEDEGGGGAGAAPAGPPNPVDQLFSVLGNLDEILEGQSPMEAQLVVRDFLQGASKERAMLEGKLEYLGRLEGELRARLKPGVHQRM